MAIVDVKMGDIRSIIWDDGCGFCEKDKVRPTTAACANFVPSLQHCCHEEFCNKKIAAKLRSLVLLCSRSPSSSV